MKRDNRETDKQTVIVKNSIYIVRKIFRNCFGFHTRIRLISRKHFIVVVRNDIIKKTILRFRCWTVTQNIKIKI